MKIIKQTPIQSVLAAALLLYAPLSLAASKLNNISINEASGGKVEVMLSFSEPVTAPKGFSMTNPSRLVFDFPGVEVAPSARKNYTKRGIINSVNAASNKGQARLVFNVEDLVNYSIEQAGSDLVLLFDGGAAGKSSEKTATQEQTAAKNLKPNETYQWYKDPSSKLATAPKTPATVADPTSLPEVPAPKELTRHNVPSAPAPAVPRQQQYTPAQPQSAQAGSRFAPAQNSVASVNGLRSVDFRRNPEGGAEITIILPNNQIIVKDDKSANNLSLILQDMDVPASWQKNMDVVDFATPVSNIQISQRGANGKVNITASEDFTYRTERKNNVYTVYVDKIKEKKADPLADKKKKTFSGEKLSLNFQDIEVRAVLQLLADFTNKNIVVSDTVSGNITVRLKDVPWDQALDIVLESKNLGMRENGNVIWVAPNTELDAKDAQELELAKKKVELEKLVTEYIPVNFAKASELAALIEKRAAGKDGDTGHSLLSSRGSVSFDERTNTLLVQDTATQVAEIRDLLKVLDVPVQQVLIESRIVIANDEFGKQLGARFGVTPQWTNSDSKGMMGNLASTNTFYNNGSTSTTNPTTGVTTTTTPTTVPSLSDRLSVNLPVAGAAGAFGFSILASDFLLDLELSALQAESKGEIVSTPRVITSNQTKAVIQQGVEIPYQEASSSGATSVSFKKAVLSLEVTPQITPDEHISMDLKVNQDTVGTVYAGVPSIDTRQVQTRVLVENGQTIVLGGVHEENKIKSGSKVPVLGDLPVVGQAFRNTKKTDSKRELLIFVTPKIVDGKS